jgi:hypothetical protein
LPSRLTQDSLHANVLQISIHEDLNEALSTSLTSPSALLELPTYPTLPRPPSPTPTTRSARSSRSIHPQFRPRSPTSSIRSIPIASTSLPQTHRTSDDVSPTTLKKPNPDRSSWASGLWVWSGKKPKLRRGSAGSIRSNMTGNGIFEEGPVAAGGIGERFGGVYSTGDDEDSWRRGDGGSSPSFRAIFLATVSFWRTSAISYKSLSADALHFDIM